MYQKLILVGNLGRDPEMRFMPSGSQVTNFSLATSEKWTGQDGAKQERTTWFRIAVYGKAAEAANQYLKSGNKVLVEGRLSPDPKTGGPKVYTKQDGTFGASYEVTALTVKFLTPKNGNGNGVLSEPETVVESADESEIPF